MIFNNSKYTNTYWKIVNRARDRVLEGYSEKHHIIPRSLGGSDDPDNIAVLTGKEHYICHLLLTKMLEESSQRGKMIYAFMCMANLISKERYQGPRASLYEALRLEYVSRLSQDSSNLMKQKWQDPSYRDKTLAAKKEYENRPETRADTSRRMSLLWQSEEYRQSQGTAFKEARNRPDIIDKVRTSNKTTWSDPKKKAEHSIRMKEVWAKRKRQAHLSSH